MRAMSAALRTSTLQGSPACRALLANSPVPRSLRCQRQRPPPCVPMQTGIVAPQPGPWSSPPRHPPLSAAPATTPRPHSTAAQGPPPRHTRGLSEVHRWHRSHSQQAAASPPSWRRSPHGQSPSSTRPASADSSSQPHGGRGIHGDRRGASTARRGGRATARGRCSPAQPVASAQPVNPRGSVALPWCPRASWLSRPPPAGETRRCRPLSFQHGP
mmetsp:Transcript_21676/g.50570  ORF Transcript_21676/g.50570 Transcript_21676/m.50570 type:complete len:215 (-) Transcript_21676:404-1048(-)